MLVSCKISNAVFQTLAREGQDSTQLSEDSAHMIADLRDTNSWLAAGEMEVFLEKACQRVDLTKAGHQSADLKSWGILDSVLRMMGRPQEILLQPEKFLSYFISPPPPIANLVRSDRFIVFDVPILAEQYPRLAEYLTAALESLPLFSGKELAKCTWTGSRVRIDWVPQDSLFPQEIDPGFQLSPDLMRDLLSQLQRRAEASVPPAQASAIDYADCESLRHEVGRLNDYLVRSHQLIQILTAGNRVQGPYAEAMKRVNWQSVQEQYPGVVQSCFSILGRMRQTAATGGNHVHHTEDPRPRDS